MGSGKKLFFHAMKQLPAVRSAHPLLQPTEHLRSSITEASRAGNTAKGVASICAETEPRLPEGAEGERPARRARSDEDQRADSEADDVEGSFHDPTEPGAVDAGGFADDEDAIVDPRVAEARFGVVPVLTLQDFLL